MSEGQRGSTDARFLQSIIEVASGQKVSSPIVAAGPENSQLAFFTNPEKIISQNQKKEKGVDDILAEIEKILCQLKENK
ncbi:hypothetical protein HZC35_04405 [Candidatus Saganbacteria bacterium]|nr:hypothetical protein [Candidatus Saganbacteria bacterium]